MHRYKPETEALRQLIDASGLTHAEIAARIGIELTEPQVSNLSTQRKALTVETLRAFLKLFRVPIGDYEALVKTCEKRQADAALRAKDEVEDNPGEPAALLTDELEPLDQSAEIRRSALSILDNAATILHALKSSSRR